MVEDLPVGVQQRVEIIKALVRDAEVLILDEPTAVLTPQETDELLDIIRQLKPDGKSIVFISHKLREVKEISDTITVIRRGKVVGSADPTASATELASAMVGRAVSLTLEKAPAEPGEVTFKVSHLTVVDAQRPARRGRPVLRHRQGRGARHRRRAGQRADGTDRGHPGHPAARHGVHHPRRQGTARHAASSTCWPPASASCRRTAPWTDWSARFSIAENMVLDLYDRAPFAKGIGMNPRLDRGARGAQGRGVRRAHARRWTSRWARSPAATSRRSSWPANCAGRCACSSPPSPPAGWTWDPSNSCTSASSPNVTTAPRS